MDERNRIPLAPILLVSVIIVGSIGFALFVLVPNVFSRETGSSGPSILGADSQLTQDTIATFTAQPQSVQEVISSPNENFQGETIFSPVSFEGLYDSVGPGVVNIQVFSQRDGMVGRG